jgi:hypothetical protein
LPGSLVALRVDTTIVGAVPADRVSAPLGDVVERASAELPTLGADVDVVGVMGMDEASEAVVAPAPGEPLHVLVAGAEIDVDAYQPLLDVAARTGGHVEFVVRRTDGG